MNIETFIQNTKGTRSYNRGFNAGRKSGEEKTKAECIAMVDEALVCAEDPKIKEFIKALHSRMCDIVIREG